VIVLFIVATLSIVAFLISLDYEMVTDNHYEKAVEYQDHIERVEHASNLSEPVTIELLREGDKIQIKFPSSLYQKSPVGTINLYRPNNSDLDQQLELMLDAQGVQKIPAADLTKGKWLIKLNWTIDSTSYFKEENIFL
jgi:hypothetical protein